MNKNNVKTKMDLKLKFTTPHGGGKKYSRSSIIGGKT